MTIAEIAALDVKSIVDPSGCVLALWVPSTLLSDGLQVMKSWGFALKSTVIWVKSKKKILNVDDILAFGMGRLFRQTHEIALIGTAGKSVYSRLKNRSQRSVIIAPNQGHSIKPNDLHESFDMMFPDAAKCELFARRQYPNWTCLGNEIDGKDIRVAISDLNGCGQITTT
jgi:N6-adenosine-specific RNA methylase IME4